MHGVLACITLVIRRSDSAKYQNFRHVPPEPSCALLSSLATNQRKHQAKADEQAPFGKRSQGDHRERRLEEVRESLGQLSEGKRYKSAPLRCCWSLELRFFSRYPSVLFLLESFWRDCCCIATRRIEGIGCSFTIQGHPHTVRFSQCSPGSGLRQHSIR